MRAGAPAYSFREPGSILGLQFRPACGEELADLPARQPFAAGHVVKPWSVSGRQFPNRPRRDLGRNGRAELVGEQLQGLPRLPRPAHLLVEPAVAGGRGAAVERRANDGVLRIGQHDLLRRDLGFRIDAQRIDWRGLVVIAGPAIKDQIGGKEDKRNLRRQLREQGGDFDVELAGQRGVCLAFRAPG